jgi:hypothetical protein
MHKLHEDGERIVFAGVTVKAQLEACCIASSVEQPEMLAILIILVIR